MKIAFVVPGLDPTGPIFVIQSLSEEFVKMGHSVTIFYLRDRKSKLEFICPVKKIKKVEKSSFEDFDIIHSHCFSADRFVRKLKLSEHTKWITTIHQDTFSSFKFQFPSLISRLLTNYWLNIQNRASGVIAISKNIYDTYRPIVKTNYEIIYNGINVSQVADKNHQYINNNIKNIKNDDIFVVATYANIVKRKGIDQILDCMKINNNFKFVIIGDGPYKSELETKVKQLELQDRVNFIPFIRSPYLCLKYVDVYVMPSYSEAFGLAVVEAASMGCPIVCSDIQTFHELFNEDEAVFFPLGDIKKLSEAIVKAYSKRYDYSKKGKLRAEQFSKEKMAEKHIAFYNRLLEK